MESFWIVFIQELLVPLDLLEPTAHLVLMAPMVLMVHQALPALLDPQVSHFLLK
jgi:hypothetical protein